MVFEKSGQFEEYFSQPSQAILDHLEAILGHAFAKNMVWLKRKLNRVTRLSFLRGPRCGPRAKMMILLRFFNDF